MNWWKRYSLFFLLLVEMQSAPAGPLVIDPTITIDDNLDDVTRDTRIQGAANWGSDATLMIGKKSDSVKKRTLIKFDFAYSGIPSNATILNALLQLYYYDAQRAGGSAWVDRWVQAHQVLNNWDELQADSLKRLTGVNWLAPRGKIGPGSNPASEDANGQFESTMLFQQNQTGTWKVWNLSALTQKWINGAAANYGVILWATNEDVNAYDLRFYSCENATNKPKLVVTWSNTPKTVYFLKDHLGSIRATVLDSATAPVIGYDDYDPWGYPLAQRTKAIPNAYLQGASKNKFTGKERDDEFGLNLDYFGARYYDSQIGRWPTVDPLGLKHPGMTPYNYVLNNPLRLIDPDGKQVDFYDMLLIDQGLREKGYSEQVIQDLHKGEARGVLLGAAIGIGGVLAAEVGSYLLTAALFNPVTTNQIGIAITEALSPGAENATAGTASKLANVAGEIGETTAKAVPVLRQQYVEAVTALRSNILPTMREAGMSSEQIARALHAERRALGEKFKNLTPPQKLQEVYERNLKRYGDRLGPSIEWLRKQGKSWEDIIESATKTGGQDLGF
jgi:RHS repeat-associated protein